MYYRRRRLRKNTTGVLGQPFSLFLILFVAAVILLLLAFSINNSISESQRYTVEQEINSIITEASTMFEYANEGTICTLHLEIPRCVRYIVFGGLPSEDTAEPLNLTLNETTSNNYYYVLDDGSIHLFHSNTRFSDKTLHKTALLFAGSYDLSLELCQWQGSTYVAMY